MARPRQAANGDGSVYPDGDKWVASITIGMQDGKPVRKKVRKATKQEARKELERLRRLKESGSRALTDKQSTEQYLHYWLTSIKATQVRPRSLSTYRVLLETHVYPLIGKTMLTKLNAEHIQRVVNHVAQVRSVTTAQYVLTLLRMALEDAYRRDMILKNVAKVVEPPRGSAPERQPLTTEQARRLLESAVGVVEEGVYWAALLTGMRQGEILGLRWQDVDLDVGSIVVRWSLQGVKAGIPQFGEPKTASSRRVLYIPDVLRDVLHDQQRKQSLWRKEAKIAGKAWAEHDLVFTTKIGRPITDEVLRGRFQKLLEKAGLPPVHFHDMRHSCQTFLADLGVPERTNMDILGHKDVKTTRMVYTHSSEAGKRQAAHRLGDLFADVRKAI